MSDCDTQVSSRFYVFRQHNSSAELFFEPVVNLPPVTIFNTEENEDCIFENRAKLFRYDTVEDPPEWKERGTGCVKVLKNKVTGQYRILMRRSQTLKVCANHNIMKNMHLRPNCGSDRAFVWTTLADFSDGIVKPESLGIKFRNSTIAKQFCEAFEEGAKAADNTPAVHSTGDDETSSAASPSSRSPTKKESDDVETKLSDKMEKQLVVTDSNPESTQPDDKVSQDSKQNGSLGKQNDSS